MNNEKRIGELAQQLGALLVQQGMMMATAESCTGGWLAKAVTDVAGSSNWFDRGFVTYSNAAKQDMLGVRRETLEEHGAVSEATVRAMAEGALLHSLADVSVAISGIAGPGGATPTKPVGTVWMAWSRRHGETMTRHFLFAGDREAVRAQAVMAALEGLLAMFGST
ncbi:MAG: nicotinamide-nucleotide amidase [Gammaproteobacteria bacterium]|nr:nicotinamide-nucleotide amidase [Gammaproteobacteria bacterium]